MPERSALDLGSGRRPGPGLDRRAPGRAPGESQPTHTRRPKMVRRAGTQGAVTCSVADFVCVMGLQLIFSVFKTLTDQEVVVELKNDLSITGTLKSVDQ